jgi:trehalose 6-phosphate phosphatase
VLSQVATEQFRAVANARGPLLIALDLDGTLAPVVDNAADARVPAATLAVLDRLAPRVRMVVITGRDLNTARRRVPCDGVEVIGSHGLEATLDAGFLPHMDRIALAAALESVEDHVTAAVPSAYLQIERKAISTAFHYRVTPELEDDLRMALEDLPDGLRLREGRMVLEVLPNTEGGKDIALGALLKLYRPKSILTLGDDVTDAAMFRTAIGARNEGVHVLTAGVVSGEETPLELLELSDVLLSSTDEALEALETVARSLGV